MKRKKGGERTITGIVVPENWDDNDNIIRVGIMTPDYQKYVIEHNKNGKELLAFIDHKVKATGTLRERLDGDIIISVKSYELTETLY